VTGLGSASLGIRTATDDDWAAIYPILAAVVAAGRTYAYPEDLTTDTARSLWMEPPPGRVVVAVADGVVVGTAKMGPNRPGRGAHVATASFLVAPDHRGCGIGRALGDEVVAWATAARYDGIQFNAVVETNVVAVRLWQSLGFEIVGTVPRAFDDAEHGLVGLHVMYRPLAPADTDATRPGRGAV
jgi:L-amino acid N-acyltransferase YncA